MARGLDVFRLTPSEHLSQNEIDAATEVRTDVFNAQHQSRVTWPATPAVARAYVDQLTRTRALSAERAEAVRTALSRVQRAGSADAAGTLDRLATDLETEAGRAAGTDRLRLQALSATLKRLHAPSR
jgi:hypothetical protein